MAKKPSKGGGKPIPKVIFSSKISPPEADELLNTLKARFNDNSGRHSGVAWASVQKRLKAKPEKLASLYAMENTGGEPDVIGVDEKTGGILFCDCSAESPQGRRSICYDGPALAEREKKGVYPGGNAVDLAAAMGIELLNEDQYRELQKIGEFDTKTSSWIYTPADIRKRGGALFADRRYGHIFVYHNGAPSFYASRGFRGLLRV